MAGIRGDADERYAVTSYKDLRVGIGILGMALPFVLVIFHPGFRESISAFYYTNMRDWFVGSMWAIGFFLIFYRYRKLDNVVSSAAGVLAILVSLFPTTPEGPHPTGGQKIIGGLHLTFAAGFLLLLAYMCFFLFTRTDPDPAKIPTRRKHLRNTIYRGAGIAIFAGVIAAALFKALTSEAFRDTWHPAFWCESVAVFAFGVAWLIKGETLFKDE